MYHFQREDGWHPSALPLLLSFSFIDTSNGIHDRFNSDRESIAYTAICECGCPSKISTLKNECFWNYPTVIKGAFFHEAVSHLFNRVKTQNR